MTFNSFLDRIWRMYFVICVMLIFHCLRSPYWLLAASSKHSGISNPALEGFLNLSSTSRLIRVAIDAVPNCESDELCISWDGYSGCDLKIGAKLYRKLPFRDCESKFSPADGLRLCIFANFFSTLSM